MAPQWDTEIMEGDRVTKEEHLCLTPFFLASQDPHLLLLWSINLSNAENEEALSPQTWLSGEAEQTCESVTKINPLQHLVGGFENLTCADDRLREKRSAMRSTSPPHALKEANRGKAGNQPPAGWLACTTHRACSLGSQYSSASS